MDMFEEMQKMQRGEPSEFGQMMFKGWIFSGFIGTVLWPYIINSWQVYNNKPPTVCWWQGALIGLIPFIGPLSIPAAVVTWILMMILK
jgi:hypothetical protein